MARDEATKANNPEPNLTAPSSEAQESAEGMAKRVADKVSDTLQENVQSAKEAAQNAVETTKHAVADRLEDTAEAIINHAPNRGRISRAATALAARIEQAGVYLDQLSMQEVKDKSHELMHQLRPKTLISQFMANRFKGNKPSAAAS